MRHHDYVIIDDIDIDDVNDDVNDDFNDDFNDFNDVDHNDVISPHDSADNHDEFDNTDNVDPDDATSADHHREDLGVRRLQTRRSDVPSADRKQ